MSDAESIGQGVVFIIVALAAAKGAWEARKARKNTATVGNGWTDSVDRRFDRLETLMVNHLEAHAESDLTKRP